MKISAIVNDVCLAGERQETSSGVVSGRTKECRGVQWNARATDGMRELDYLEPPEDYLCIGR